MFVLFICFVLLFFFSKLLEPWPFQDFFNLHPVMLTTSEALVFRFCSIFNNSPQTECKERPRARKNLNKSASVRRTILRAKPIEQTEENGGGGFKFNSHFRFLQTAPQKRYLIKIHPERRTNFVKAKEYRDL